MAAAGTELGLFAQGLHAAATGATVDVVVTGNEASDADSIVSALLVGFLKQKSTGGVVVPIVACDRQDMPLRQETTLLLGLCGVNWQHLIFGDDAFVSGLLEKAGSIVLVDHNKATGPIAKHATKVTEIVDHHKDLGDHAQVSGPKRLIAFEGMNATAGSACTLVAELFAARALLGVIHIDTVNLDPAAKKVTPRDIAASELCATHAPSPSRQELFDKTSAAKNDLALWDTLTPAQCFRYDYKSFTEHGKTYGLSSCLCSLETLCAKPGFLQEMQAKAKDMELFGTLTNVKTPTGKKRELLLFSHTAAVRDRAVAFLKEYKDPPLELTDLPIASIGDAQAFNQGNIAASRKQVAPALGDFMATL